MPLGPRSRGALEGQGNAFPSTERSIHVLTAKGTSRDAGKAGGAAPSCLTFRLALQTAELLGRFGDALVRGLLVPLPRLGLVLLDALA